MSAFVSVSTSNVVTDDLTLTNRITVANLPTGGSGLVLKTDGGGIPGYVPLGPTDITPGTNEQSLWTSAGATSWLSRSFRFGFVNALFAVQDWNLGASTTNLNFLTFGFTGSRSYGPAAFNTLSVSTPGLSYLCNTTGTYKITIMACLVNGGIASVNTILVVLINGTINGTLCLVTVGAGETRIVNNVQVFSIAAGSIISFQTQRSSGSSPLSTSPQYSSLTIECLTLLA
jgi:hypothetical protein